MTADTTGLSLQIQIQDCIQHEIAPFVERDGGTVRFRAFEHGIVYVDFFGACTQCSALNITLKAGIERRLRKKFAEVKAVRLWQDYKSM